MPVPLLQNVPGNRTQHSPLVCQWCQFLWYCSKTMGEGGREGGGLVRRRDAMHIVWGEGEADMSMLHKNLKAKEFSHTTHPAAFHMYSTVCESNHWQWTHTRTALALAFESSKTARVVALQAPTAYWSQRPPIVGTTVATVVQWVQMGHRPNNRSCGSVRVLHNVCQRHAIVGTPN